MNLRCALVSLQCGFNTMLLLKYSDCGRQGRAREKVGLRPVGVEERVNSEPPLMGAPESGGHCSWVIDLTGVGESWSR